MRRLALIVVLLSLTAGTAQAAPTGPCNPEHYGDFHHEDGVMYECRCFKFSGEEEFWCSWMKVGSAPAEHRRLKLRPTLHLNPVIA